MSDLDDLVRCANNWNVAKNLSDGFHHPYTRSDGEKFITMAMSKDPLEIFAIEVDGDFAGSIGFRPDTDIDRLNAELGYWLAEPYWGKGIMPEAIKQLVSYTFETFPITRIYARPFGHNLASQRVLEKAGFTLEARFNNTFIKNGELTDELIYAMRKT
jgi:RimJ/RimL family protein N-acetyltransferase